MWEKRQNFYNHMLRVVTADLNIKFFKQKELPLHELPKIVNPILVGFWNGDWITLPANLEYKDRVTWIGPRYYKVHVWAALPSLADQQLEFPRAKKMGLTYHVSKTERPDLNYLIHCFRHGIETEFFTSTGTSKAFPPL
jgi:hypothetical protein